MRLGIALAFRYLCLHEDRRRFGNARSKASFWLVIALTFRYLCHTKAEDGAFGYGRCRDIEDSYPAWKQAGLIYILYVR